MDATCTIQDSIHVFSLVHKYVSRILGTYQNTLRVNFTYFSNSLQEQRLLDNCSNTTVNVTNCIVLNISNGVSFYIAVHFVIIISISKVFQVQNKPMGFLPPI